MNARTEPCGGKLYAAGRALTLLFCLSLMSFICEEKGSSDALSLLLLGVPAPECGNGTCGEGEDCATCPADCGCQGGLDCCGGTCVDFQDDINNCGECDNVCGPYQQCASGVCTIVENGTGNLTYQTTYSDPGEIDYRVESIAISQDGRFLYAAWNEKIVWYARDAGTGGLSGRQVHDGTGSYRHYKKLALTHDGKFLYAIGWYDAAYSPYFIACFSRNEMDGTFTHVETITRTHCTWEPENYIDVLTDIAISPDDKHIYLAAPGLDRVVAYSRDLTTGQLAYIADYEDWRDNSWYDDYGHIVGVEVSPDGDHVYTIAVSTINGASGESSWFYRDKNTGELSDNSDPLKGLNVLGTAIDISPDGTYIAALSNDGLCVQVFVRYVIPEEIYGYTDPYGFYTLEDGFRFHSDIAISPGSTHIYAATNLQDYDDGYVTAAWFQHLANHWINLIDDYTGWESTELRCVAISPDGNHVYMGGYFGVLLFFRDI